MNGPRIAVCHIVGYRQFVHCVVTAGPTYEPLDKVRRLTNFSTGQLGTELANFLTEQGHTVTLLRGEHATHAGKSVAREVIVFSTTADLHERLHVLAASSVNAVFHAAAVSDFRFGKVWLRSEENQLTEIKSGKLSTREGTLLAELVPTAKILMLLRDWFPNALLCGWKFEVDGDRERVYELARSQLAECRTDACIANGPAYGDGFGLVQPGQKPLYLSSRKALFEALNQSLGKVYRIRPL
jgi:phosphopantothenoylcysteine decarboxylase/phosphopantothenate--cysteine ligase